jgi:hypothetical protein
MRSAEHVVCMRDEKFIITFSSENLCGREHLEDMAVDGRIILR